MELVMSAGAFGLSLGVGLAVSRLMLNAMFVAMTRSRQLVINSR